MTTVGRSMKSTSINGFKSYMLASEQVSPARWLADKKKSKKQEQKLELIQDLRFETATSRIKATPDGDFLIASGIYPPKVKVYELRELSLKFERHFNSEIIDFQVLSDDYSKLVFLCADRSVSLHAKQGKYYTLRIPRMGRNIAYDCWSCDLLCAASSPDLYRINLEQGQFLHSLSTQSPALNVVCRSKLHGVVACGGDDGAVECFDTRTRSSVGRINAFAPSGDFDSEVTVLEFDEVGGFVMAVGSSAGKVMLYDLRSSHPIQVMDHMYSSPILDIKWHHTPNSEQQKLITTDSRIVRIWDPETGNGMTSIEPTAGKINDVCVFNDTGLMLLALDCSQIPSYFIPALGPAPKWCPDLDNQTEEMEVDAHMTIYDNLKFLEKEELEKLKLTDLIGTNLLRAYMHGYFVDYRLYKKAKALADPFDYGAFREDQKNKRTEAQRGSRITIRRRLPKVNRTFLESIQEQEADENDENNADAKKTTKKASKRKELAHEMVNDPRFSSLFENKDFEIDKESLEYKAIHQVASKTKPSLMEEHFEPVMEIHDRSLSDSDASEGSHTSEDEPDNDKSGTRKRSRIPRMYEVKDERHVQAFWSGRSTAAEDSLPMGERVQDLGDNRARQKNVKLGPGGSREISFISRCSARCKEDRRDREDKEEPREKKRGVQSLGLSSGSGFRGRGRGRGRRSGRGGGRGRGSRGMGRGGRSTCILALKIAKCTSFD